MAEKFNGKLSIYRIIECKSEFNGKNLPYNIAVNPISNEKNVIIGRSSMKELRENKIAILQDANLSQWKHLYERVNYVWYEEMPEWAFLYAILIKGNEKEQRYYLNSEKHCFTSISIFGNNTQFCTQNRQL